MRGYDRVQVDLQIQTLMTALAEARREVETLDARNATLAGDLSEAQRRLRETDRSSYTGLGERIEQLLRSAEEQSTTVINKANADAEALLGPPRPTTQQQAEFAQRQAQLDAQQQLNNTNHD